MVKIGDLVTPRLESCTLFPVNFNKIMFGNDEVPKSILFMVGGIGTVLELGGEDEIYYGNRSMKILTSGGIGWCLEDWVEVVNETG